MLSGPPTAAMIASGAEVVVVIKGLSLVVVLLRGSMSGTAVLRGAQDQELGPSQAIGTDAQDSVMIAARGQIGRFGRHRYLRSCLRIVHARVSRGRYRAPQAGR